VYCRPLIYGGIAQLTVAMDLLIIELVVFVISATLRTYDMRMRECVCVRACLRMRHFIVSEEIITMTMLHP
jgi:hypothetical protein